MEKDDTTKIKTEVTNIQPGSESTQSNTTRLKSDRLGHSITPLASTELKDKNDPLSDAPTVLSLSDSSTASTNSAFAGLDRRVIEQYADKKVLKQRFVLTRSLGAGGMGNVYLAKDLLREEMEDSTPHVAIKVLNDECRNLPGALQALQSEAKKAQALSHPNIVTVYDFDRDGDVAFISMEYIDGEELKDTIRRAKIPHVKAMMIIDRVSRGLAYAHQQGFVHSDIKPANIFCGRNGVVKILDFGIAKAFTAATMETRSLGDQLTEGALTPAYASLEMIEGKPPHPSDDVYSLACMAYELLSGRHPFMDTNARSLAANVAKERGLKPKPIPGLSRRHMRALRKGLAFDKSNRFSDAGEFIDAIKTRNLKKTVGLVGIVVAITGAIIFSGGQALDKVVPSVQSLKPSLIEVANTIRDGDEFIEMEDIDFAHRLYSQAWALASDLTKDDLDERDRARSILSDRMRKISTLLISRLKTEQLDEFQQRELLIAFEFMLQDEITNNDDNIKKAIQRIKNNLTLLEENNQGEH